MILLTKKEEQRKFALIALAAVFLLFPIAEKSLFNLPLYGSEVAFLGALVVIYFWQLSTGYAIFKKVFFEERTFLILLSIFLFGIVLSALIHSETSHFIGKLKSFYLLPLLFAVTLSFFLEKRSEIRPLLWFWMLGILAASAAALGAASHGWVLYDGRLAGPYSSANYLALLVAPGTIIATFFFLTEQSRRLKTLALASISLIGVTLYLTHSYATWLALATSLFFGVIFFNLSSENKRKQRWFGLVLILGLVIGALSLESGTDKWAQLISADPRSSLASRQIIWRVATDIATDNPWFGIGTGNFQSKYLEYQHRYPSYLEWAVPTPHNLTLHFWLEGGILAFMSWLGILFLLGQRVWCALKQPLQSERRPYVLFATTLVLFYIVYGLVDTPYMKNDLTFALWGSIGLLIASLRIRA